MNKKISQNSEPLENKPVFLGVEQELPREKLIKYGTASLTDQELLAILLRTGSKGINVLQLAASLIQRFDGLNKLLTASYEQLQQEKGLGPAKVTQLVATLELCRRVLNQKIAQTCTLTSPNETRQYLQLHFQGLEREVFACLFLDSQHQILALENLFYGTINSATVHPREIVKAGLRLNASAVILAHNHPSGNAEPSQADIRITQTIKDVLALVDIRVLDHMVIGAGDIVSLAERGNM